MGGLALLDRPSEASMTARHQAASGMPLNLAVAETAASSNHRIPGSFQSALPATSKGRQSPPPVNDRESART